MQKVINSLYATVRTAHATQKQCCKFEAVSQVSLVKNVTEQGYGKNVSTIRKQWLMWPLVGSGINESRNRSIWTSSRLDRIRIHNPAQHNWFGKYWYGRRHSWELPMSVWTQPGCTITKMVSGNSAAKHFWGKSIDVKKLENCKKGN